MSCPLLLFIRTVPGGIWKFAGSWIAAWDALRGAPCCGAVILGPPVTLATWLEGATLVTRVRTAAGDAGTRLAFSGG